jgi:hypothetical protein
MLFKWLPFYGMFSDVGGWGIDEWLKYALEAWLGVCGGGARCVEGGGWFDIFLIHKVCF